MQDIVLSQQNYNSPVKFIEKQLIFDLSLDNFVTIEAYWQKINIETDQDYWGFGITEKVEKRQHLKFEQYKMNRHGRTKDINNPY